MADSHGPAPGRIRVHLAVTRTHGIETTLHGWICPACGHPVPLSTDDYAPATEPRRCRRVTWNALTEIEAPACPRCYTRLR